MSSNHVQRRIPVPISCEFFPTATEQGGENLAKVRRDLTVFDCEYFSVTYGAGGSTQERTLKLVRRICEEDERPVMPHLTCISATYAELEALLDTYQLMGIKRLLALRGDVPPGSFYMGELDSAADLVQLVRKKWGDTAHIVVAAYPEKHPRAKTPRDDLEALKIKSEAGANEAVTQYFFNADAFLRFRDEACAMGIEIPLVPGIMPITNYRQLARFSDACGAELPRWIRKRLEAYEHDVEALQLFGTEVVASLCERLVKEGAPALHFYSMNRSQAILAIGRALSWID